MTRGNDDLRGIDSSTLEQYTCHIDTPLDLPPTQNLVQKDSIKLTYTSARLFARRGLGSRQKVRSAARDLSARPMVAILHGTQHFTVALYQRKQFDGKHWKPPESQPLLIQRVTGRLQIW